MVSVRKREKVYEYRFSIASIGGKRKWISKSGFTTKKEAIKAGIIAYNEYIQTGHSFTPSQMSYSDYLDYWLKTYCHINLRYHTIEAYTNIIKNHIKPQLGYYMISQVTTSTLQEFINNVYIEKSFSKNFLKNILKVLKGSFGYATDVVGFVKINPALKVRLPKYDKQEKDSVHIFTKEEVNIILERFKNRNDCVYYAFLTAYYTGLRVSEVFALTWNDIDLKNKTLSVNKNVIKKNQAGATKNRQISGNSTTVWFFGDCKTSSSVRTISIGDTLVNHLTEYKEKQEKYKQDYGEMYMKHYLKEVSNVYTNKPELKIVNAYAEIDVALPEVHLVFLKNNGIFEGTDSVKYPFKVIHYELGISCRFHDFRDTHSTRLIESGADIKAVSERLGHSTIATTYNTYVKVTSKMKDDVVDIFEKYSLD